MVSKGEVSDGCFFDDGGWGGSWESFGWGKVKRKDFAWLCFVAEEVADGVFAKLPRSVKEAVGGVGIFFEGRPNENDVREGLAADLLGLFDPGPEDAPSPRIRIWLENIWDYCGGGEREYRREVEITLLHEIGHLVGWDEEGLELRGLD